MASKPGDSDGGSMTPSEPSDGDDRSDRDSDYESDNEEESPKASRRHSEKLNIQWTGYARRTPVIVFCPDAMLAKKAAKKTVGERYHMTYKFGSSECKIVRNIFNYHGFHEVHPNSSDFNIIWTGGHLKPFTLRSLTEFQKVNHFPRSYEITRKDRLFKNIQRMQQIKGVKHFDFIPQSYILPSEYQDFCAAFLREKGLWIVKPVASSRGRGVFLCNHPDQVPLDENLIVCKYIANPLLIDGFKFDIRLYVCVTSYDPLCIYLFEEGLTRFATVKYEKSNRHIRNQCMHLTNYSVNKKSDDYVKNDDPDVEDYGNKWSLGAFLRYLRSRGKDTAALMMRIEDVVIKTIVSVEVPVATACKMFMPFRGNCFELYGFDILVDDNLKPWVLEVNLSPSLACDSPLDMKIKTNMMCDLFSLSGVVCHDPMMRTLQQSRRNQEVTAKIAARAKKERTVLEKISDRRRWKLESEKRQNSDDVSILDMSARYRPSSASSLKQRPMSAGSSSGSRPGNPQPRGMAGLNSEEIKILRRMKEEDQRKGGWVRIFPTPDSWDLYSSFLQFSTSHNLMVHSRLYPDRHKGGSQQAKSVASTSAGQRAKVYPSYKTKSAYASIGGSMKSDPEFAECYAQAISRTKQYERKLGTARKGKKRNKRKPKARPKLAQGVVEDQEEDEEKAEESDEDNDEEKEEVQQDSRSSTPVEEVQHKVEVEVDVVTDGDEVPQEKPPAHSDSVSLLHTLPAQSDSVSLQHAPPAQSDSVSLLHTPPAQSDSNAAQDKPPKPQRVQVKLPLQKPQETPPEEKPPAPARPPPPPPEPKYNVVELLQKGRTLSKCQARGAFAMYLVRVQQRLISEVGPSNQDDSDALNEQMDLVLRFLKRAAVNLQQPFKVVVPSRKLPLADRRRILAKQLGDFVHIYNKETDQLNMKRQQERQQGKVAELHPSTAEAESQGVCEEKFDKFVNIASEGELEEVLTTYTKINKSASIFLGGHPKNSVVDSNGQTRPTSTFQHSRPPSGGHNRPSNAPSSRPPISRQSSLLQNRPGSGTLGRSVNMSASDSSIGKKKEADGIIEVTPKTINGWEDTPKFASDGSLTTGTTATTTTTTTATRSTPQNVEPPHTRVYHTPSQSSYANAVQVYTQKLTSNRPRSASSGGNRTGVVAKQFTRPMSAMNRPSSANPYATTNPTVDSYNDQAIHDALQRLALRQQARQYSAYNGTSMINDESRSSTSHQIGQGDTPQYGSSSSLVDTTYTVNKSSGYNKIAPPATVVTHQGGDRVQTNAAVYSEQKRSDNLSRPTDSVKYSSSNGITEDFRNRPPSGQGHRRLEVKSASGSRKPVQSNVNLRSANATFNSFIEDSNGTTWNNDLAHAYNQVTGVLPSNYHSASQSSKQYQIMQQQAALKQQSKAMLEQSKAKHQAMIAQAHAVQKSVQQQQNRLDQELESAIQMYAPKPPAQPPHSRKPPSSHRVQRSAVPDDTLNFNFYNSLQFDQHTGRTRSAQGTQKQDRAVMVNSGG
uniref:Tubulin--tyrosine ligase-like protein 5 n=1 Tax=Crassostrea virginica TaxID=6565 RepID=A0A8B8DVP9_CRAVI|nr:tubulin polyglutamylase TTLL5-like isoform X11 [Crassostrea virginica]